MTMTVPEPGQKGLAGQVDLLGGGVDQCQRVVADGDDPITLDGDRRRPCDWPGRK